MEKSKSTSGRFPIGETGMPPVPGSRWSQRPWRAFLLIFAIQAVLFYLTGFVLYGLLKMPREMGNIEALSTIVLFSVCGVLAYVFAPFFLHIPYGKRRFSEYLGDIRLTQVRPFFKLLALTASCVLVLVLCQGSGSLAYRLFEGKPLSLAFIADVFDLSLALPPRSLLLIAVFYTMLEEVAFRGVLLRMLLRRHPAGRAILYSALAFGLFHLPAVFAGRPLLATLGQVVWATLFGLFYGYLTFKTDSLFPAMIIHWLSNVFQSPLTAYWQAAAPGTRTLLGIVFGYGLATLILIPWVRVFSRKWLPCLEESHPAREA
jgi:membrane protease YdiL (CAAX protease family)